MIVVQPHLITPVDIHPLDTRPTVLVHSPTITAQPPDTGGGSGGSGGLGGGGTGGTGGGGTGGTGSGDLTRTLLDLIASQYAGAGIPGPADQPIVDPLLTSQASGGATSSQGASTAVALVIVAGIALYLWYRHHNKNTAHERAA